MFTTFATFATLACSLRHLASLWVDAATSISPWVVTLAALEPFLCPGIPQHPLPLEYLRASMVNHTVFDIALTLSLRPEGAEKATLLCETNYRHL